MEIGLYTFADVAAGHPEFAGQRLRNLGPDQLADVAGDLLAQGTGEFLAQDVPRNHRLGELGLADHGSSPGAPAEPCQDGVGLLVRDVADDRRQRLGPALQKCPRVPNRGSRCD